jgi:hypothetical protein
LTCPPQQSGIICKQDICFLFPLADRSPAVRHHPLLNSRHSCI